MPRVDRPKCNHCDSIIKCHQPCIKCTICNLNYHRQCASNLNRHNRNTWRCNICIDRISISPFSRLNNTVLQNDVFNNPIANGVSNPSSIDPIMLNDIFINQSEQNEISSDASVNPEFHTENYALSNDIDSYCDDFDNNRTDNF